MSLCISFYKMKNVSKWTQYYSFTLLIYIVLANVLVYLETIRHIFPIRTYKPSEKKS